MFAAAIFDMDGVLIDSERVIVDAYVAAARDCGHAIAEADVLPVIGMTGAASRTVLLGLFGSEATLRQVGERAAMLMRGERDHPVFPAKAGAHDLLAALAGRGVPMGVASSTRRREVLHRLAAVGLDAHLHSVTGGDEVERGKPDPSIYLLAAQRLGVAPSACIAFEDSDHGAEAAHAAGLRVVVVPDLKPPGDATRGRAFEVLGSLGDVGGRLSAWFPTRR